MKKITIVLILFVLSGSLFSQTIVSTDPENKNVVIEEFTGQNCPNCPDGHAIAQTILDNNPGDVFVIAYHPTNSSYTLPELDETFPDVFYSTPYCGTSRFMPSAFICRRIYDGERLQSRSLWTSYTNTQLTENSPVNVGVSAEYSEETEILDILVEAYYTADVTDGQSINVMLIESGIVAYQSNGGSDYVHNHIFRDAFTAQWGDIIVNTTQSSLYTQTYTFDNSSDQFNMEECEIVAFVLNTDTEEIESGNSTEVDVESLITTTITSTENNPTNSSNIPITIEFEEEMTGFELSDIDFTDCSGTNFQTSDDITYTLDLTPDSETEIFVIVPASVAQSTSTGTNNGEGQFSITYDATNPEVTIDSDEPNPTTNSSFEINIEFNEEITGFTIDDISISNASVENLQTSDNITFTADVNNYTTSLITIEIAQEVATDLAGNNNNASNIFEINAQALNISNLHSNIIIYATNNNIIIENAESGIVYISDISGKIVNSIILDSNKKVISENYKTGIYIIKIVLPNSVYTEKIYLK